MKVASVPGGELIETGIKDLVRGSETVPALLVCIGAPRLRRLGLDLSVNLFDEPEIRLYRLLSRSAPDGAHSRYNALIRRLVSFERALECAG